MDEKQRFIDKWRVKLGCEHDPYSTSLCWCKTCTALENLWRDVKELRKSESEIDIRKEFWRYIPAKKYYIYLFGEGDSVSFASEERVPLSKYFFPSRFQDDETKEYCEVNALNSLDIILFATKNHPNKVFLVIVNPEVELSEVEVRDKVCYLYAKRDDLNF